MDLFAEREKQPQVKKLPEAPTKIKGADVLKEYLLLPEKQQKFFNFARKKSK